MASLSPTRSLEQAQDCWRQNEDPREISQPPGEPDLTVHHPWGDSEHGQTRSADRAAHQTHQQRGNQEFEHRRGAVERPGCGSKAAQQHHAAHGLEGVSDGNPQGQHSRPRQPGSLVYKEDDDVGQEGPYRDSRPYPIAEQKQGGKGDAGGRPHR